MMYTGLITGLLLQLTARSQHSSKILSCECRVSSRMRSWVYASFPLRVTETGVEILTAGRPREL